MNAYDWILVVILVLSLAWGLKTGFIRALFAGITIFIAFIITGRIAPPISSLVTTSELGESAGDSIVYWITFAVILLAANWLIGYVRKIVNFVLTILLLGPVDKLAGMAMGAVLGILVTMAFVMTTATYAIGHVSIPGDDFAGQQKAAEQLADSTLVPIYVTVWDVLPADTFGMVPDQYARAMDDLDGVIEFSDITGALSGEAVLDYVRERFEERQ